MVPCGASRRLRRMKICAYLLIGFVVLTSYRADAAGLHPQDGPHVDVKIRILAEQVMIRLEMNLVFLDEIIDFPRERSERVSGPEFEEMVEKLAAFFATNHLVKIDGIQVRPTVERVRINDPDLALLPLFPMSGEMGLRKVRFDLSYPLKQPPTRVDFEWTTFPPDILLDDVDPPPLAIAAEIDAEGRRRPIVFSIHEPGYTWHALGDSIEVHLLAVPVPVKDEGVEVPVVAIGLVVVGSCVLVVGLVVMQRMKSAKPLVMVVFVESGCLAAATALFLTSTGVVTFGGGPTLPSAVEAEAIFTPLHANLYRAFDYVEESDIYDALAQSADGPFLDTIYRTIFRSLVMEEEGGAVARVARVKPLMVEVEELGLTDDGRPVVQLTCQWRVDGLVSHWGHAHARSNVYLARWNMEETTVGWRLSGLEILEQDRVDGTEEEEFDL